MVYRKRRRGVLRQANKLHKVDAVFISNSTDIRYLTGCTEGSGGLLLCAGLQILYVGKMFEDVVSKQAPGIETIVPQKAVYSEVSTALNRHSNRRALGFQGNVLSWAQYQSLEKLMKRRKLVNVGDLVIDYRAVKDDDELKLIRKCVRIAERSLTELVNGGTKYFVGKSEKQIAADLEYAMRNNGADRQGFELNGIIVASGPNSASCHHLPSNRKVRRREPLLIDWGAELDGYRSDITRTLFMGSVPQKFVDIYETVLESHKAGALAMKAGVHCQTVAKSAWDVVRDAGYGETIRHGLGHGLGMNVHERPGFGNGIKPRNGKDVVLRKNMVMTIEPGIYYDEFGGVRIEDDYVVTAKGCERLNSFPRHLDKMIVK